ncbi:MAG: helix-turn-helix transcriptional regulator [Ignavibacteriales bacterium]
MAFPVIENDEHWSAIANLFGAAALDGDWISALNAMADACGAESGELIGVGSDAAVPFNWVTRRDTHLADDFVRFGFSSPTVNPRVREGLSAPVMRAWHEVQCSTQDELRRNFSYADFCRSYDIPYGSQTTLMRENGMLIGLATLRGEARGVPQGEHRAAFEAIAPQVRSAVKMQMALERQGSAIIGGALGSLDLAAFVCDRTGLVRAVTPAAEAALAANVMRLKAGRLSTPRTEDSRMLEAAIAAAAEGPTPGRPSLRTLVLRGGGGPGDFEVADVITLPRREYSFGFEPRVLVTLRTAHRRASDLPKVLSGAFDLTPVEASIAVSLADGQSRNEIAAERNTSVETIRSHIKKIFAKLDVKREAELAPRLRRLF